MKVKINTKIELHGTSNINSRDLEIILKSLKPDNIGVQHTTTIDMKKIENGIGIYIKGEGRLGSFIQTMDDLLRCFSVLIKALFNEI